MSNGLNAQGHDWNTSLWFAKRQWSKQRRQASRREIEARLNEMFEDALLAAEELNKELAELYNDLYSMEEDWGFDYGPFDYEEELYNNPPWSDRLERELDSMLGGFCN